VIVHDFHIDTVTVAPHKTDSPLVVNADRMLTFAISAQGFQLISGRRREDTELCCRMKLKKFPERDALKSTKSSAPPIMKQFFGFGAREALDHTDSILRNAFYAKDNMHRGTGARSVSNDPLRRSSEDFFLAAQIAECADVGDVQGDAELVFSAYLA
jgi:hypothetical protein